LIYCNTTEALKEASIEVASIHSYSLIDCRPCFS